MRRRYDPDRRDRIIESAYESIAENGVEGTSNRVVAAMTDVPLGSITYHFNGRRELLLEVFHRYATQVKKLVEERLPAGLTKDEAIEAVVRLIHEDFGTQKIDYNINYELYALAARDKEFQEIVQDMTESGQRALARYFGSSCAYAINTYIEGASTHLALRSAPQPIELTRQVIRLLTNESIGT